MMLRTRRPAGENSAMSEVSTLDTN